MVLVHVSVVPYVSAESIVVVNLLVDAAAKLATNLELVLPLYMSNFKTTVLSESLVNPSNKISESFQVREYCIDVALDLIVGFWTVKVHKVPRVTN